MTSIHDYVAFIDESTGTVIREAGAIQKLIKKLEGQVDEETLGTLTELSDKIFNASRRIGDHLEAILDETAGLNLSEEINAVQRDMDDAFEAAVACKNGRADGGYKLVAFFQQHFPEYQGAEVTFKGLAETRPADYWEH